MKFLKDKRGRVPFAVIGIILLMGSTITSTFIINIENELSKSTYEPLKKEEIDSLLSLMQTDLAIALNYAAINAMDYIGKNPVTSPNIDNNVAKDYNGGSWNNWNDDKKWSFEEMLQFNMNWARNITRVNFNRYVIANYMYNAFNNGKYAINVIGCGEDPKEGPIEDWRDIKISEFYGKLNRESTKSISSLPESVRGFISKPIENEVPLYWQFEITLPIEIVNIKENKVVAKRNIKVSTLATSRLPLIIYLANIYEESLKGSLGTGNIFALMTLLSEAYTEARALAQYGGMRTEVPNIVDNRWLKYLTNLAILIEQFAVFNSIDAISAVYLIWNYKDLFAKGFPEGDIENVEGIYEKGSSVLGNLLDIENIIPKTISKDESIQRNAEENINQPKSKIDINITRIAEDLLYNTTYSYYYANKSNGKWEMLDPLHKFKGYYFEDDNGKRWKYITAPPYIYENLSTHEEIEEQKYNGEWIYKNGKKYVYSPEKNKRAYNRIVNIYKLGNEVNEALGKIINETYRAEYEITAEPEEIKIYWKEAPPEGGGWIEEKVTDWKRIDDAPVTANLEVGDVIPQFPHVEKWKILWEREHKYIKIIYGENGTIIDIIRATAVERKEVTLKIELNAKNYPSDVNDVFNITNVNLKQLRTDYNLFNATKDFVIYFVGIRENIFNDVNEEGDSFYHFNSSTNISINISKEYKKPHPYAMGWLYGINGEVAEALKEIFEEIKKDNITAIPDEKYKERDYEETITNHISQLKQKFAEKMEEYINDSRYRNGDKYISCGARVVAKMRKWYVETIWNILNDASSELENELEENVKDALNKTDYSTDLLDKRNEIKDDAEDMGFDLGSLSLQFGLSMPINIHGKTEWIGFSINQEPKYFDYKDLSTADLYRFKVKNECLFGPTGLPILPTPITPWVITINVWYIEIQGSFSKFEVADTVGEMLPNVLFGDVETKYARMEKEIKDEICSGDYIGTTSPIKFSFSTINVAITPPGFVGDINPTSYPKEENKNWR